MDLCISVSLALLAVLLVCVYLFMTGGRGYIETLGLPVEPPHWIFGSEPRLTHKHVVQDFYVDRVKTLGKSFLRYDGKQRVLVTIDPDLVKSVLVKNFESFDALFDFGKVISCIRAGIALGGIIPICFRP